MQQVMCHKDNVLSRHNIGAIFERSNEQLIPDVNYVDIILLANYTISPPIANTRSITSQLVRLIKTENMNILDDAITSELILQVQALNEMGTLLNERAQNLYDHIQARLSNPISNTEGRTKRDTTISYLSPVGSGFLGLAKQSGQEKMYRHMLEVDRVLNEQDAAKQGRDEVLTKLSRRQEKNSKSSEQPTENVQIDYSYH